MRVGFPNPEKVASRFDSGFHHKNTKALVTRYGRSGYTGEIAAYGQSSTCRLNPCLSCLFYKQHTSLPSTMCKQLKNGSDNQIYATGRGGGLPHGPERLEV